MENDTQKAKVVGRSRRIERKKEPFSKRVYYTEKPSSKPKCILLTGNEVASCRFESDKKPPILTFTTKRQEQFHINSFFRFKNKMTNYSWRVFFVRLLDDKIHIVVLEAVERIVYSSFNKDRNRTR